jgi:LacI family transcriptional regulator
MRKLLRVELLIETAAEYGRGLLRGIARYARLHGRWSVVLEPAGWEGLPVRLRGRGLDGVIALVRTRRLARAVRRAGVPVVDVDFAIPGAAPWGVKIDEGAVARTAAEHLLACGLRSFAYVGWGRGPDGSPIWWDDVRSDHFVEFLRARGFEAAVRRRPADDPRRLARWLGTLAMPVGVMAGDDQRGRHVIEAARLAGLRVPEDMAVIGVDNDEVLCEMCVPSLSSVVLDTGRIGFEAARALDGLMRGRRSPRLPAVVGPMGVVARRSTDILALRDPGLVAAVRYIRTNAHRPIRVSDVLREVPLSRRALELRFREALGRTPRKEIERVRLERVRDLLGNTDWPLKRIAQASGFAYTERMHAVFRREARMTPTEYRAVHRVP